MVVNFKPWIQCFKMYPATREDSLIKEITSPMDCECDVAQHTTLSLVGTDECQTQFEAVQFCHRSTSMLLDLEHPT